MNFFGHACVASWESSEPAFVLGAMLPDFAAMAGARLGPVEHPELGAGIRLHRRTDAIFHRLPAFQRLYREGASALRERGVARGMARGAAHVGVELLLDGVLIADRDGASSYLAALSAAGDAELDLAIRWCSRGGRSRWLRVRQRLGAGGVPVAYRDAAVVADRVERALSGRPRLALDELARPIVVDWLADAQPAVWAAAGDLIQGLRDELALRGESA